MSFARVDDGTRRSTPSPPVSKRLASPYGHFSVPSVVQTHAASRPELPEADIEMGRGWTFRPLAEVSGADLGMLASTRRLMGNFYSFAPQNTMTLKLIEFI